MVNFNRGDIQDQVSDEFKRFKWSKISNKNMCNLDNRGKFALNNTQEFVNSYFTEKNENGILLFHSVGSGKTLSAIGIIKKFQEKGFNAIWITRATLKKDLDKALTLLPVKSFPVFSYKQWSNICKKRGENYKVLMNKSNKLGGKGDPFYKTVIIVDEAHKLYTKDLKAQEMHDINIIQKTLFESYNVSKENRARLVLMTGTPVTEDPVEALKLLNLIITSDNARINISKMNNFDENYFSNKINGLVSYIDASKDSSKFAQIKYTEVYVPVSEEPEDKLDCPKVFKDCIESGFSQSECKKTKEKCVFSKKVNKGQSGKSQTELISKKCKTNLK